ncbi:MAG: hypothetical protein INQ03_14645 [Candidatus Heimdallarchaeota archaeon]|nr:hypothetical protein [Candidatus Heimdallarchaeota archaeon]
MRKAVYGVPWVGLDILQSRLKTKWKILDYTQNKLSYEEVMKHKPEVLIAFSPPAELLELDSLKYVITPGAGVDNMDTQSLKSKGITIVNTHGNASTVAEHGWGMLLSIARNYSKYDRLVRERGVWPSNAQIQDLNVDLFGKRIGILGYGAIGKKIEQFALVFGMEVSIFRNHPDEGQYFDDELEEQADSLDVLFIACPLTSKTRGLVSEQVIYNLPAQSIIINVGRGAILDEQALFSALREGSIRAAALDVWQNSPYTKEGNNPPEEFLDVPNLLISPHRAWISMDSFVNSLDSIASNMDLIANNDLPQNIYDFDAEY